MSVIKDGKVYVVITANQLYLTSKIEEVAGKVLKLKDALAMNLSPDGKIGVAPPIFASPKNTDVIIHEPINVIMYEADEGIANQYSQIITSMKTGIVPAKAIPQTTNPQITKPELKIVE